MKEYEWKEKNLGTMLEEKAVRLKDKTFLYFRDDKKSYADINREANRVANGLAKLGLKKDDKVCIMLMNVPEYIYFWWGAAKLGIVEVPVNVAYKGDLLEYIVNNSEASAIVVDSQFMDRIEFIGDGFENIKNVIVFPEWKGGPIKAKFNIMSYNDMLSSDTANPPSAGILPSDPMAIMYTSGTTGPSKGVIHSHGTYHAYAAGQIKYARLTENDVLYAAMPYFHTSSQALSTYAAFVADASVVMAEKFSVKKFWDEIRKYNCTFCLAVGAMFNFLGGTPEQPGDADNPLRVFNGGPFPAKYVGAFEKRFGVKCLELYGNVESGCMTRSPYDAHRPGSCGKAADEYEVRIVDEYDNPVPPGTVGEFVCRTKEPWTFMTGYYKMPDKTADTFRNLWLHTGDGGKMDEDGYFYFVDRIKDAMRKRGENISSFEVEKVINSHPKIQESAAYGIKSTEWTEDEVMVAIVLKPGETLAPEELIAFCEDRMAAFAVPRFVEFKTTLPKTPTERVEKYKLKAEGVTAATWDRMAANP